MSVREAIKEGVQTLMHHRCMGAVAVREAETLLAAAMARSREYLLANGEAAVPAGRLHRYRALLRRRAKHEPLEYIIGFARFYGRPFAASPATLIPRPATEWLVASLLDDFPLTAKATVIDAGTGSGVIAVTVARERPLASVIATDVSADALRLARRNAAAHGVSDRISFVRSEFLPLNSFVSPSLNPATPLYIIANLPYIPSRRVSRLQRDVRDFEPRMALDGGKDGLTVYRTLLADCANIGQPFSLFCEFLPTQFRPFSAAARRSLPGCAVAVIRSGRALIGARVQST